MTLDEPAGSPKNNRLDNALSWRLKARRLRPLFDRLRCLGGVKLFHQFIPRGPRRKNLYLASQAFSECRKPPREGNGPLGTIARFRHHTPPFFRKLGKLRSGGINKCSLLNGNVR